MALNVDLPVEIDKNYFLEFEMNFYAIYFMLNNIWLYWSIELVIIFIIKNPNFWNDELLPFEVSFLMRSKIIKLFTVILLLV